MSKATIRKAFMGSEWRPVVVGDVLVGWTRKSFDGNGRRNGWEVESRVLCADGIWRVVASGRERTLADVRARWTR